MKDGVLHQVGKPQDVYDDPVNLFVAEFLGTPEINVFDGKVKDGGLYIGDDRVLEVKGVEDKDVWIGVRPEGFEVDPDGKFNCELAGINIMGRDITVLSNNKAAKAVIRSIVSAETKVDQDSKTVRFNLKPYKTYIFDKDTEERIRF